MSTNSAARKYWIAVASAERVRRGRGEGFMQINHGKAAPLKRVNPGDLVIHYSPALTLGGQDKLQSFTAIGTVKTGEPYLFAWEEALSLIAAMSLGPKPSRRPLGRCSKSWHSPPASRTVATNCVSDFSRSAPLIFARSLKR